IKTSNVMNKLMLGYIVACVLLMPFSVCAREIALTFDDAPTPDSALMSGAERTTRLIAALKATDVPDALFFVKADYINLETKARLEQYTQAGFHPDMYCC